MNQTELEQNLRMTLPLNDMKFLKDALSEYLKGSCKYEFSEEDVRQVRVLAARKSAAPTKETKETGEEVIFFGPPGVRQEILSKRICEAYEGQVERVRTMACRLTRTLSRQESVDWLDQQQKRDRQSADDEYPLSMSEVSEELPPPLVVYNLPGSDGKRLPWRIQPIALGSILADLSRQVELLFLQTGFEREDIARWILEGERPTIYRHRTIGHQRYPLGAGGRMAWVTLELRASDITWKELWEVYREIRSATYTRRQPPSDLHVRIYEIVEEWGGIPAKGKGKFWNKVRARLLQEKQFRRIPKWQGIRRAYHNLIDSVP